MSSTPSRIAMCVAALVTVVVSPGIPTPAGAQAPANDHLKCYKVTDPLRFAGNKERNAIDLLGPQFGLEANCQVTGAFRLFCVPVSKQVKVLETRIPPGAFRPTTLLPVGGAALADDRMCYRIKCPGAAPPDQLVTDQFASRTVEDLKPYLLCTPAIKGPLCTPSTEICNGQGDDCDAEVDEGCACVDGQQQSCGSSIGQCQPGLQTCAGGSFGPCQGAIEPSEEVCDGLDNDCDGQIDDDAGDAATFFADADADGYGNVNVSLSGCASPPGYVTNSNDCNDTNAAIHPGAVEACGNGLDDDCDSNVDEGCVVCTPGETQVCSSGGAGICAAGTRTCNQSGTAFGPCVATAPETEQCNGLDDDCDGQIDDGFNLSTDASNCGSCGHVCTDSNSCTNNFCSAGVCMTSAVSNGTLCDDSDPCTQGERCSSGFCIGTPVPGCS